MNDDGGDFFDHIFNALGHATRAVQASNRRAQEAREAARATRGPRKVKAQVVEAAAPRSFDAAPSDDPSCCTARRK